MMGGSTYGLNFMDEFIYSIYIRDPGGLPMTPPLEKRPAYRAYLKRQIVLNEIRLERARLETKKAAFEALLITGLLIFSGLTIATLIIIWG